MKSDPALEAYFAEAAAWDADRATRALRSERRAWWVAAAGWAGLVLLALALLLMTPLKRVEPFVIRVDRSTGVVDVVPVYVGSASMPETVTRYFLAHYVTVCERFDAATAESDYEECGAFHTPRRNQEWAAAWARTNPASPLNRYKDGTTVAVAVRSISFFTRASGLTDMAQVRYSKLVHPAGGSAEQRSDWIATVQYAFAAPASDASIRRWNPLGFKILTFRSEPETPPGAAAAQTLTTSAGTGMR